MATASKSLSGRIRSVRRQLSEIDAALARLETELAGVPETPKTGTGPNGETAAERIVAMREARGMTQRQLATSAGMNASQLCKIEHGASDVTGKTAVRLASALGVSVAYILCGSKNEGRDFSRPSELKREPNGTR